MRSLFHKRLGYVLVGVAAFVLGSATIGAAAATVPAFGTIFYTTMQNGQATTPCRTITTGSGPTTTCVAVVDADGNLHVLAQGTTAVNGTVNVGNFPATQPVSGTVSVSNLPTTQNVNIVGGSTSSLPLADTALNFGPEGAGPSLDTTHSVNLKVIYAQFFGVGSNPCAFALHFPTGFARFAAGDKVSFPIPVQVVSLEVGNPNPPADCQGQVQLIGY